MAQQLMEVKMDESGLARSTCHLDLERDYGHYAFTRLQGKFGDFSAERDRLITWLQRLVRLICDFEYKCLDHHHLRASPQGTKHSRSTSPRFPEPPELVLDCWLSL
jgi:hypothetical protein